MKFLGSVIGKIFLIVFCLILGGVLTIGGIAGGVYWALTTKTVGEISDMVNDMDALKNNEIQLNFDDETRELGVGEWAGQLIKAVSDMNATTVGKIEGLIGTDLISNALTELIGTDAVVIKESTLSNLAENLTKAMTVDAVVEKTNIEVPDIPLFSDDSFMLLPLSEAFGGLTTDYPLKKFIKMNESDTNAVMLAIKDLCLDDLGGEKLTDAINGIKISDLIDINESESHRVLVSLKDITIGEIGGSDAKKLIDSMFIYELIEVNESSSDIIKSLKYATLASDTVYVNKDDYDNSTLEYIAANPAYYEKEAEGFEGNYLYAEDGTAYVKIMKDGIPEMNAEGTQYHVYKTKYAGQTEAEMKNRPIIGISERTNSLRLGDVVEINGTSLLMNSLQNSTLGSISKDINRLFISEITDISADNKLMNAIKYCTVQTQSVNIDKSTLVAPTAELKNMEIPGYSYLYTEKDGVYTAYVACIDDATGLCKKTSDGNYYVVYETKTASDDKNHPLISISDTTDTLFMDELIEINDGSLGGEKSSRTLITIRYATLKSHKSVFDPSSFTGTGDAAYELPEYTYYYSAQGTPYIKIEDAEAGKIVACRARMYDGKLYPMLGIDDKINSLTLGDVIEIDDSSSVLMKSLKNELITDMDKAVNRLFLDEILEISDTSPQLLKALRYAALSDDTDDIEISKVVPYSGATDKELTEYEYVYMSDGAEGYIPYIRVKDGSAYVDSALGAEYYYVYKTKLYGETGSEKYYPIIGIAQKIDDIKLNDVFTEAELQTGILSLLPGDSRLNDISAEAGDAISNNNLATLIGAGVIDDSSFNISGMKKEQRAFVLNSGLEGAISGSISFLGDPIEEVKDEFGLPVAPFYRLNTSYVEPQEAGTLTKNNYVSLDDFVVEYTYNYTKQFCTLTLTQDTVVNVDENVDAKYLSGNDYIIPIFNLEGNYTLSFVTPSGKAVKLGVKEGTQLENVSRHQYAFAYDSSNGGAGSLLLYTGDSAPISETDGAETYVSYSNLH